MVYDEQILKDIESLEKKEYLPKEYIDFCRDLFKEQRTTKVKLSKSKILDEIPAKNVEQKLKEGVHILDLDRVRFEKEPLSHLFLRICEAIEQHGKWEPEQIERLKRAVEEAQIEIETFVRSAALKDTDYFESLSESLQIEKEYLYYFGIQIGKPLLELIADEVKGRIGVEKWKEGFCPVCGQEPAMAKLEGEEGRRILHCSLCSTEWDFRRVQCPYCLNDDHETLKFFFVSETSPYRVDVCDVCKRYVKTIDERKLEEGTEIHLEVESLGTIFLDMMASNEGYKVPQFHIFDFEEEWFLELDEEDSL